MTLATLRKLTLYQVGEGEYVSYRIDGGRSWPVQRAIEPGAAGYCDLAEGPDGTIYCHYEGGIVGDHPLKSASVACARRGLDWLTATSL